MEKARRDALRAVVNKARRSVEESLERQLSAFGLSCKSTPIPREDLALHPAQEALYPRLLDAVRRQGRAVGADGQITPQAVTRFVRETGGTWINRLAALRALEARGLLAPAAAFISDEYGGGSPRAARIREAAAVGGKAPTRDEALRAGIESACRELTENVRVLFDLTDEQSLLWPDTSALKEILRFFSVDVPNEDWREPDVLGWVYQYYNTEANAELKRRKARTTGFQYTADDIPIANQFYTPHWVVRVLTDNTLGRLWLESRERVPLLEASAPPAGEAQEAKPSHTLRETRIGIPHAGDAPDAFRAWLNGTPDPIAGETVDQLCRFLVPLPSRPIPRPRKRARELRVIDPACGSGHFLLYAFDVLFAIYREDEPDLDPREIPALILQNNLFGIDIDLRAAQLAAFDLYLKARETLFAIDSEAPLKLQRLNIVIADAHIGNDPRRATFLDRYKDDPEIRQLYAKVLEALDDTNALGSLIKVRTEFEGLFRGVQEAHGRKAKAQEAAWGASGQLTLVDGGPQVKFEKKFRSHSGRQWTLDELLEELRGFESEVAPGQDIGARLFYADLERSVGLLSLLSQQYDVVLMNPPYGDMPPEAKDYCYGNRRKRLTPHYPRTHSDLYAAFIEQALDLLVTNGLLGALVPWTFTYLSSLESVRKELLFDDAWPELIQEYGYGILDGATVGTVSLVARRLDGVARRRAPEHRCTFHRLSRDRRDWQKESSFRASLPQQSVSGEVPVNGWFVAPLRSLQDVPGMPYSYWASESLRRLFRLFPAFDIDNSPPLSDRPRVRVARTRAGLHSADDSRFLRLWWEVPVAPDSRSEKWRPFVKGGPDVSYFTRIDLRVNWGTDGSELRQWAASLYGGQSPSRLIQGTENYFRSGITWPRVSWRLRKFGVVDDTNVISDKGPLAVVLEGDVLSLCGLLNSELALGLLLAMTPERMWELRHIAAVPVHPELCQPTTRLAGVDALVAIEKAAHDGDETFVGFRGPDLLMLFESTKESRAERTLSLGDLLQSWHLRSREMAERKSQLQAGLDAEIYRIYGTSVADQAIIGSEVGFRLRPSNPLLADTATKETEDADDDLQTDLEENRNEERVTLSQCQSEPELRVERDLVARWLSRYLRRVIDNDSDGIVPVTSTEMEPSLLFRIRHAMARDLGEEASRALESQAPGYLGTRSVEEWLAVSREETAEVRGAKTKLPVGYFPWHVSVYRNRPIFWLLSSENFETGRVRFTFRAYIHYLKLTPDTLPKLLSHYLENTISWVDREWKDAAARASTLEGKWRREPEREADEWLQTLDALRRFETAIREVIAGAERAVRVPTTAKWLPRTIAAVRGGQDLGHGYQPDVDFGVRVNIIPLVEKRLLPRVVLKKLGG